MSQAGPLTHSSPYPLEVLSTTAGQAIAILQPVTHQREFHTPSGGATLRPPVSAWGGEPVNANVMDRRVTELLELAESEGLRLPYPPSMIVALEETGAIIDLHTGAILPGEADKPYRYRLTVVGEALAVVLAAEGRVQP